MIVLYSTNIPSPQRVDYFNELEKYCELTVLFEKMSSSERDKKWKEYEIVNFNWIIMKGISINTNTFLCLNAKKH